jgi:hypothetical protein
VLTKTNAHEQDAMIVMAERWGLRYLVYSNLSPTIYGGRCRCAARRRLACDGIT